MTTEIKDPMVFYSRNHSYCDWRVTLSCEDGQTYKILYISNLAAVSLIAIACIILLWYRIRCQGCAVFSPKIPGTGFIRPNPVEGFLVWAILWLIGRIFFILVLWSGKLKDNYSALETLQELYWTCGSTGCAWFVIGTYLQIGSHLNSRQRPWRPNNKLSDSYLLIMTIIVPMTIWPITVISGYLRDYENAKLADILIRTRYMLWGFWFGFGAIGTLYFGKDLCSVLSHHISVAKESSHITVGRVEKMQSGLKKIKITLYIIMTTYLYYLTYCIIASMFRIWIITHSRSLNIFMFVTYSFFNPLCIIFVVATISIRIIQSNSSPTTTTTAATTATITKKLINNNNNNNNNNNLNTNLQYNTSTSLSANNFSNKNRPAIYVNGLAREIPELDSITAAIAHMDQHQFDDLVAYTQFNTNNNNSNSVGLINDDVKQIVEKIEESGSGSGSGSSFNELNEEEQHVVVRPASPTIPIFSTNRKEYYN